MKIRVEARTNKIGSESFDEFEIDDEDLEGMTTEQRNAEIDEQAREVMFELIEWDWKVVAVMVHNKRRTQ